MHMHILSKKLNQYNPDMLVLGYQKEYRNGFTQKYKQKYKMECIKVQESEMNSNKV